MARIYLEIKDSWGDSIGYEILSDYNHQECRCKYTRLWSSESESTLDEFQNFYGCRGWTSSQHHVYHMSNDSSQIISDFYAEDVSCNGEVICMKDVICERLNEEKHKPERYPIILYCNQTREISTITSDFSTSYEKFFNDKEAMEALTIQLGTAEMIIGKDSVKPVVFYSKNFPGLPIFPIYWKNGKKLSAEEVVYETLEHLSSMNSDGSLSRSCHKNLEQQILDELDSKEHKGTFMSLYQTALDKTRNDTIFHALKMAEFRENIFTKLNVLPCTVNNQTVLRGVQEFNGIDVEFYFEPTTFDLIVVYSNLFPEGIIPVTTKDGVSLNYQEIFEATEKLIAEKILKITEPKKATLELYLKEKNNKS